MIAHVAAPMHELERSAALVRAIRRAYSSPEGLSGVTRFTVTDVHDFARRLLEQGVTVREEPS